MGTLIAWAPCPELRTSTPIAAMTVAAPMPSAFICPAHALPLPFN